MRELRRIHASRAQWDMVLQLAEHEIALPMRSEERAELLVETAGIWLRELREPEQARELLVRALALVPEQPAALEALARACEAEGQPREAASSLGSPGGAPGAAPSAPPRWPRRPRCTPGRSAIPSAPPSSTGAR